MANRNLRAGRGDRRGAMRLALFVFGVNLTAWLLMSHHSGGPNDQFAQFFIAAGNNLLQSALTWMLYIALEPLIRRHYPQWLIGWSRLLGGAYRDPLVAKNVLIGAVAGAAVSFIIMVGVPLGRLLSESASLPQDVGTQPLHGFRWALGSILDQISNSIFSAMLLIAIWFLLSRLLRLRWLAGVVFFGVLVLSFSASGGFSYIYVGIASLAAGVFLLILGRFGLLALISMVFVGVGLSNLPVSLEASAWHVRNSWPAMAVFIAIAAYSFRASLGGRSLFGDPLGPE